MGCDIHLFVENRIRGKWFSADKWSKNEYYKDEGGAKERVKYEDAFYSSRNYDLFAILANVRNGRGFAGVKTGEGFRSIRMPRGIPDNVSAKVKAQSKSWGVDGHSHSYLTVDDILSYDWTQKVIKQGVCNGVEWEKWKRCIKWSPGPDSYSGAVWGEKVNHIEPAEMDAQVQAIVKESGGPGTAESALFQRLGSTYATAVWQETYASCVKEWWWDTMPKLLNLGHPQDVRIVFWFDN